MANEKRLIDANEVLEEINDAISNIAFTSPYQNDIDAMVGGMERVLDMVEDAPTVDAVEVVRCKDCKHRGDYNCPMYYDEYIEDDYDGYHDSTWIDHDRTADDGFCDRGEREDSENP